MKIKTLRECTREHLETVLEKTAWDLDKTARLLQVPIARVRQKIEQYGMKKPLVQDQPLNPSSQPKGGT